MIRCRWGTLFLAVALVLLGPPTRTRAENPIVQLAERLQEKVDYDGIDDNKATLLDALDDLRVKYHLSFDVNEDAFKAEGVEDVFSKPVGDRPIPKMLGVSLRTVLTKILQRVPSTSGATFLVRRDYIEITTVKFRNTEVWGPSFQGPFLPLVCISLKETPLRQALTKLADQSEYTIILDDGAVEDARRPITTTLTNVPLDTAARLLGDMAGLRSTIKGNVVYVSTAERTARIPTRTASPGPEDDPNLPDVPGPGGLRAPGWPIARGGLILSNRIGGLGAFGVVGGGLGALGAAGQGGLGALGALGGGGLGALGGGGLGALGGGGLGALSGGLGGMGAAGVGGVGGISPLYGTVRSANFEKRPAQEALGDLVKLTGYKLVLDTQRVGNKADKPITLNVTGVSCYLAILLVADQVDLQPVFLDEVVYLTSRSNARLVQAALIETKKSLPALPEDKPEPGSQEKEESEKPDKQ